MNAKHTPGPWRVMRNDAPNFLQIDHVSGDLRSIICRVSDHELCPEHGSIEANTRLIAAAPELLAALIELASGHSMAGEALARAAIAKATEGGK